MKQIPFFESFDERTGKLTLRGASHFPPEIFDYAEQIKILDIPGGTLRSLPDDLPQLEKLKVIFLSNNLFTEVPEVFAACKELSLVGMKSCRITRCSEYALPPKLRWLILTDNLLKELPASLGNLSELQKVALAGNQLSTLPDSMTKCSKLQLLRLSANNFQETPPFWLFQLPSLAWYTDAGNPFCEKLVPGELPQSFERNQISYLDQIGRSPSSDVYRARLEGHDELIAIKDYKGKMTSDGYIVDDLRASLSAGQHKNIITALGQIAPSQENPKASLLFQLIPEHYKSLGQPPSLETCTRDTFPENTSFSESFILSILKNIASAMSHLHKKGISHGDLYAHNILADVKGHCFLGDFGAASFYEPAVSSPREQIEVRAFAYLIDDLIEHRAIDFNRDILGSLSSLSAHCKNISGSNRPSFHRLFKDMEELRNY